MTLPAAAGPVLVGAALAAADGVFQIGSALAALLCALPLQIGSNFANDYFDFFKGANTPSPTPRFWRRSHRASSSPPSSSLTNCVTSRLTAAPTSAPWPCAWVGRARNLNMPSWCLSPT
ncbi:MAG: hypothetical protein R3C14_46240 [Caldilineaceae bacterium]